MNDADLDLVNLRINGKHYSEVDLQDDLPIDDRKRKELMRRAQKMAALKVQKGELDELYGFPPTQLSEAEVQKIDDEFRRLLREPIRLETGEEEPITDSASQIWLFEYLYLFLMFSDKKDWDFACEQYAKFAGPERIFTHKGWCDMMLAWLGGRRDFEVPPTTTFRFWDEQGITDRFLPPNFPMRS